MDGNFKIGATRVGVPSRLRINRLRSRSGFRVRASRESLFYAGHRCILDLCWSVSRAAQLIRFLPFAAYLTCTPGFLPAYDGSPDASSSVISARENRPQKELIV